MRVFIAYRHTGADLVAARKALEIIRGQLQARGIGSYCTLLDGGEALSSLSSIQVLELGIQGLAQRDGLLLYVDSEALSPGMYIEVGYALAKALPVYLLIKEGLEQPYLSALAVKTCKFTGNEDLARSIKTLFG